MGEKTVERIWELDLPRSHILILLAIAHHEDYDTSASFIAQKCGYSERLVKKAIADLLKDEILIKVLDRSGQCTGYSISKPC